MTGGMTPQAILEGLGHPGMTAMLDEEFLKEVKVLISHAVHFDFGSIVPSDEHVDFGFDMVGKAIFRLPFEYVLFTAEGLNGVGIVAKEERETNSILLTTGIKLVGNRGHFVGETIARVELPTEEVPDVKAFLGDGRLGLASLVRQEIIDKLDPCIPEGIFLFSEQTAHLFEEQWSVILRWLVGLCSVLLAKTTKTITHTGPKSINERRLKKGKEKIRDRIVVIVDRAAPNSQSEGWRTSPRMHWRRGHFRTLPTGVVVPVAPALVNAQPNATVLPKPYHIINTPGNCGGNPC